MNTITPPTGGSQNVIMRAGVRRALAGLGTAAIILGTAAAGGTAALASSQAHSTKPTHGVAAELKRIRACFKAADDLRKAGDHKLGRKVFAACETRLRKDFKGLHGEVTYEIKKSPATFATLGFERGVVTAVNTVPPTSTTPETVTSIAVQAADGTSITWNIVSGVPGSNTDVVKNLHVQADTTLAVNQHVFIVGPVTSGSENARVILISNPVVTKLHPGRGVAAEYRRLKACFAAADNLGKAGDHKAARRVLASCEKRLRNDFKGRYGATTYQIGSNPPAFATLAFERGFITAVTTVPASGSTPESVTSFTVQAADGTTFTWNVISGVPGSNTDVVKSLQFQPATDLAVGQHVFVIGPLVSDSNNARLVLIG
jgi:hypothetical protein